MRDKIIDIIACTAMAALLCLAYSVGRHNPVKAAPTYIERSDTVWLRDTVHCPEPVLVHSRTVDTCWLRVERTVEVHDTCWLPVPVEQRIYEGEQYRAFVSGIRPALDSIWVFPRTRLVTFTRTEVRPLSRWQLGAAAGPGLLLCPDGRIRGGIGVTAGVTYRF